MGPLDSGCHEIRHMSTWARFEADVPEVAAFANRLWPGAVALDRGESLPTGAAWFAIAYLATVRPDGAPRLHPFCPIIAGGRLFAAIPRSSPKGHDLRRDPRCVIHAMPGPDDDELCIRATATEVVDELGTATMVRTVVSAQRRGRDDRVDIARAALRVRRATSRRGHVGEHRATRHPRRAALVASFRLRLACAGSVARGAAAGPDQSKSSNNSSCLPRRRHNVP